MTSAHWTDIIDMVVVVQKDVDNYYCECSLKMEEFGKVSYSMFYFGVETTFVFIWFKKKRQG